MVRKLLHIQNMECTENIPSHGNDSIGKKKTDDIQLFINIVIHYL